MSEVPQEPRGSLPTFTRKRLDRVSEGHSDTDTSVESASAQARNVAPIHASIEYSPVTRSYWLKDHSLSSYTTINGQVVYGQVELNNGDLVCIGDSQPLVFENTTLVPMKQAVSSDFHNVYMEKQASIDKATHLPQLPNRTTPRRDSASRELDRDAQPRRHRDARVATGRTRERRSDSIDRSMPMPHPSSRGSTPRADTPDPDPHVNVFTSGAELRLTGNPTRIRSVGNHLLQRVIRLQSELARKDQEIRELRTGAVQLGFEPLSGYRNLLEQSEREKERLRDILLHSSSLPDPSYRNKHRSSLVGGSPEQFEEPTPSYSAQGERGAASGGPGMNRTRQSNSTTEVEVYRAFVRTMAIELQSFNDRVLRQPVRDYSDVFQAIVRALEEPFSYKLMEIEADCEAFLLEMGYGTEELTRLQHMVRDERTHKIHLLCTQLEVLLPVIRDAAAIARESIRVCAVFTQWSRQVGDEIRTKGLTPETLLEAIDTLKDQFTSNRMSRHWLPPSLTPLLRVAALEMRRRTDEIEQITQKNEKGIKGRIDLGRQSQTDSESSLPPVAEEVENVGQSGASNSSKNYSTRQHSELTSPEVEREDEIAVLKKQIEAEKFDKNELRVALDESREHLDKEKKINEDLRKENETLRSTIEERDSEITILRQKGNDLAEQLGHSKQEKVDMEKQFSSDVELLQERLDMAADPLRRIRRTLSGLSGEEPSSSRSEQESSVETKLNTIVETANSDSSGIQFEDDHVFEDHSTHAEELLPPTIIEEPDEEDRQGRENFLGQDDGTRNTEEDSIDNQDHVIQSAEYEWRSTSGDGRSKRDADDEYHDQKDSVNDGIQSPHRRLSHTEEIDAHVDASSGAIHIQADNDSVHGELDTNRTQTDVNDLHVEEIPESHEVSKNKDDDADVSLEETNNSSETREGSQDKKNEEQNEEPTEAEDKEPVKIRRPSSVGNVSMDSRATFTDEEGFLDEKDNIEEEEELVELERRRSTLADLEGVVETVKEPVDERPRRPTAEKKPSTDSTTMSRQNTEIEHIAPVLKGTDAGEIEEQNEEENIHDEQNSNDDNNAEEPTEIQHVGSVDDGLHEKSHVVEKKASLDTRSISPDGTTMNTVIYRGPSLESTEDRERTIVENDVRNTQSVDHVESQEDDGVPGKDKQEEHETVNENEPETEEIVQSNDVENEAIERKVESALLDDQHVPTENEAGSHEPVVSSASDVASRKVSGTVTDRSEIPSTYRSRGSSGLDYDPYDLSNREKRVKRKMSPEPQLTKEEVDEDEVVRILSSRTSSPDEEDALVEEPSSSHRHEAVDNNDPEAREDLKLLSEQMKELYNIKENLEERLGAWNPDLEYRGCNVCAENINEELHSTELEFKRVAAYLFELLEKDYEMEPDSGRLSPGERKQLRANVVERIVEHLHGMISSGNRSQDLQSPVVDHLGMYSRGKKYNTIESTAGMHSDDESYNEMSGSGGLADDEYSLPHAKSVTTVACGDGDSSQMHSIVKPQSLADMRMTAHMQSHINTATGRPTREQLNLGSASFLFRSNGISQPTSSSNQNRSVRKRRARSTPAKPIVQPRMKF